MNALGLRCFPRRTASTPDDENVLILSKELTKEHIAKIETARTVKISATFTWDIPAAERMYNLISPIRFDIEIGGPAYGDRMSPNFTPGEFVREGHIFTSRGCKNHCWFCSVAKVAKGRVIELPIVNGWNVLDDNILSTSDAHFDAVIEMLKRQTTAPKFTGGIEAALLTARHAEAIASVKPQRIYCAYDTPDDLEPLIAAGRKFNSAGIKASRHTLGCYVLVGYEKDTFDAAEKRLEETCRAGFVPYAMLFRSEQGFVREDWKAFQREWCRPIITGGKMDKIIKEKGRI